MSLILRVDVDKSYGRANLLQKIASKVSENYWLPSIEFLGYLHDLKTLLLFLARSDIKSHIYFRISTLPPSSWIKGNILNGHKIGLHAEDTRSFETFSKEVSIMMNHLKLKKLDSFTKHGSGIWKSGRNHYPFYEPEKYHEWGERIGIPFLFGNGEDISAQIVNKGKYEFYPGAFWIDRPYTDYSRSYLEAIVHRAKEKNVVVLVHCADFLAIREVEQGMKELVAIARSENVPWITL